MLSVSKRVIVGNVHMAKYSAKQIFVEGFSMRDAIFGIIIVVMIASLLNGCGQDPNRGDPMFKQRPDTDVTSSPEYNFKSFAGTVWKTKVKVALADIKAYTGEHHITLLTPEHYDPTHPKYTPPENMQMIAELPVGTRLRIERLMKDNGIAGLLLVTASLGDVPTSLEDGIIIYLDPGLVAKNRFIWAGWSDSKDWGVDPDMLEKAE